MSHSISIIEVLIVGEEIEDKVGFDVFFGFHERILEKLENISKFWEYREMYGFKSWLNRIYLVLSTHAFKGAVIRFFFAVLFNSYFFLN